MKLIIEKCNDTVYAYLESKEHNARIKAQRSYLKQLDGFKVLAHDCNLFNYSNFCMEFDVKEPVVKTKARKPAEKKK